MADVTFVRHPVEWDRAFKSRVGMTGQFMLRTSKSMAAMARVEAPKPGGPGHGRTKINYATGELAAGIRAGVGHGGPRRELEARTIALPKHAIYVHEGTVPHVITPKRAPKLVFFWHKVGRVVRLDKVNHPGTRADKFLLEALNRTMAKLRV